MTQQLLDAWLIRLGKALCQALQALHGEATAAQRNQLLDSGLRSAMVHGVTRPHRPLEIETLFMFWSAHEHGDTPSQLCLGLVLPYLHWLYAISCGTQRHSLSMCLTAG